MVHVILCAFFGRFGHGILRLTLGAHEQNAPALGDRVAHGFQRCVQHGHSLGQVKNVNAIAVAVNELAHTGVPTGGLVAVVNASFQQLTHRELGKSHVLSFFRFKPE